MGGGVFNSEYFNGDAPSTFTNEDRDYERQRERFFINLGAEYFFDDKTSFTVSGFLRNSNNGSNNTTIIEDRSATDVVLNSFGRYQDETEEDKSAQFTANFTKKFNDKGHELIIEYQTEESSEDEADLARNTNTFDQKSSTDESQKDNCYNWTMSIQLTTTHNLNWVIGEILVNKTPITKFLILLMGLKP